MKVFHKTALRLLLLALVLAGAAVVVHFLVPGGLTGLLGGAAAEPHTCPMAEHADVRASDPGRCPKCGMDLVPLSQAEHKGKLPSAPAVDDAMTGHEEHSDHSAPAKAGQLVQPATGQAGPATPEVATYYCPMHPSYKADRAGDCPICNMSLVALKGDEASAASGISGYSTVTIRPERRQLIGVKTAAVEKKAFAKTIRAAGRVEYNEKALSAVNLKFGGWVEELFVKSTGESVQKGAPLLVIYSPDLLEAQKNYLLSLEARASLGEKPPPEALAFAEQSLRSARERLTLWDLTGEQLKALEERKEPETRVTMFSKVEGVVLKRNIAQGSYAEPGRDLYEIADLSTVWVHADVYAYEVSEVKVGLEATVHLPSLSGDFLKGSVAYVYPYFNQETRTIRVRLEVPNPDGKLKPGDYGSVAIAVDLGEQLVVDDQAILDSGTRQIVFIDRGEGKLEPREVKVGVRADGMAAIIEGLEAGDKVVTSGNFLIDAESRLKAALLQGAESGMHKH